MNLRVVNYKTVRDASINEHVLQRPAPPGWVCAYVGLIITKTDVLYIYLEKQYAELSGQNSSIALEWSVIDYWNNSNNGHFSIPTGHLSEQYSSSSIH